MTDCSKKNPLENVLKTGKLQLSPATISKRKQIFLWLTRSNLTGEMMGAPKYPDSKIPTWNEFINDYQEYYFDNSNPEKGQCFIIEYDGKEIGQINHNEINLTEKSTDLDIWLNDNNHTAKGYGTQAIGMMCNYLHKRFGCLKIYISPSGRNTRAIRSYQKAGFVMTDLQPDINQMDYDDNVIMVKTIDGN